MTARDTGGSGDSRARMGRHEAVGDRPKLSREPLRPVLVLLTQTYVVREQAQRDDEQHRPDATNQPVLSIRTGAHETARAETMLLPRARTPARRPGSRSWQVSKDSEEPSAVRLWLATLTRRGPRTPSPVA